MHNLAMFLQQGPDKTELQHMIMAFAGVFALIGLVVVLSLIVSFWLICKKAGFSGWLSLLNLVPLGGLILIYILAFSKWNVVPVPESQLIPPPPPQV
jgi:uncharacterized membrane protein YhaH (DUF805 family)